MKTIEQHFNDIEDTKTRAFILSGMSPGSTHIRVTNLRTAYLLGFDFNRTKKGTDILKIIHD